VIGEDGHHRLVAWFAAARRDLPWRRPGVTPWGVLVSEVMLQQTPVPRVLRAYDAWLVRWPTATSCAGEAPGEAVRMWGRLGYPRRALRLHAAARICRDEHAGEVPADLDVLLRLPGVGDYTARAVAAFAFGHRHPVVDTNVRRVIARTVLGAAGAAAIPLSVAEAELPGPADAAVRMSAALMELGALVCTATAPRCGECPLADRCAWRRAGRPAGDGPPVRPAYAGSDRQARGRLLAVLRDAPGPVPPAALRAAWPGDRQRDRALASLVWDGLAVPTDGGYALPG
jgi:A/G-specific adenine glycosylase